MDVCIFIVFNYQLQMTDRQKIILVDQTRRDRAIAIIRNLPVDGTMEVIIQPKSKARGLDQNALYWVRLTEIAEQAFFNGRKYSKEVWHEYMRQNLMMDTVKLKNGEVVSKWVETPCGAPTTVSTSQLHKHDFAGYIESVEYFGTELGVRFSINPNQRD